MPAPALAGHNRPAVFVKQKLFMQQDDQWQGQALAH
jgi:hypothetical protein